MTRKKILTKVAVYCGLTSPILVFTLIFYAISLAPWFSWTENALSDLGVDEKAGFPFNLALILGGVFLALFTVGFKDTLPNKVFSKISSSLMFLDSVALCAIGIFPENVKPWHFYASFTFFVLIPFFQFLAGGAFLSEGEKSTGWFTVVLGAITLAVWAFPWKAVAIPEAITALILTVWIIIMSVRMHERLD